MKKIVPSTLCDVEITIRKVGRISLSKQRYTDTKFGYVRELINAAMAAEDDPKQPIRFIDVRVTIGDPYERKTDI